MFTETKLSDTDRRCLEEIALFWKMSVHELLCKIHDSEKDGICHTMPNNEIRMTYEVKMFLDACDRIPAHTACQVCRKLNLQFDDCGFFYQNRFKKEVTPPWIGEETTETIVGGDELYYLTFCADCGKPNTAER